jgi:DNA (cytosine-5)-methyltransferase 1
VNELALFAGAGGGILGGKLLGWRTVCAVEWNAYAASVLVARQNDGCLEPFPVWDDVQTFDGRPWRGIAQVVSGGFPCTDISAAGKGAGIDGENPACGSTWPESLAKFDPNTCSWKTAQRLLFEDSTESLETFPRWGLMRDGELWALSTPEHLTEENRIWIVAHSDNRRTEQQSQRSERGGPRQQRRRQQRDAGGQFQSLTRGCRCSPTPTCKMRRTTALASPTFERGSWSLEPDWVEWLMGWPIEWTDLRCLGNGQVPAVVRLAWHLLKP